MAYEALYRRYRPGRFADVTGQNHVMGALRNAVAHDRVGHAYMFSGPRGTGKTTSARILAKALNCTNRADGDGEPCDTCPSCLSFQAGTSYDLRELDAASNNGVEAMRDLISKVGLSAGGHGVFILDEAHMLSTGAENALLKTLEEPPPNVTFILCTTEPNKVVPTIRSRTQHFDFSLLTGDELESLVRDVVTADEVVLTDDDIDYVVRAGNGSARDTLSALDQVIAAGGAPESGQHGDALLEALANGDAGAVLVSTNEALRSGRDPELVGRDLLADLRNAFLAAMGADLSHLAETDRDAAVRWSEAFSPAAMTRAVELLGTALVGMRQAPDPRVDLEVALVRLARPELDVDLSALVSRLERLEAGGIPASAAVAPSPSDAVPPASTDAVPPASPAEDSGSTAAAPASTDAMPSSDAMNQAAPASAPAPVAPAPTAVPDDPPAPAAQQPPSASSEAPSAPRGRRPADIARESLRRVKGAEPPAASTPAPEPGPKPTLGSVRGTAKPRTDGGAVAPDAAAHQTTPSTEANVAMPDESAPSSSSASEPTASAPAPASTALGLAAVQAAWDGGILDSLPGNVKARFSAAVLVDGADAQVVMALPNDIHRQRCEDVRQSVDDAFGAHFGHPVPLTLITEGTPVPASSGPPPAPSTPPPVPSDTAPPAHSDTPPPAASDTPPPAASDTPPPAASDTPPPAASDNPPPTFDEPSPAFDEPSPVTSRDLPPTVTDANYDHEEAVDLSALTDAHDVADSVIDRIAEAFPGSEVIDQEGN